MSFTVSRLVQAGTSKVVGQGGNGGNTRKIQESSLRNRNRLNNPEGHRQDCECKREVAEVQKDLLNEVLPSGGVIRSNNWRLAPVADT